MMSARAVRGQVRGEMLVEFDRSMDPSLFSHVRTKEGIYFGPNGQTVPGVRRMERIDAIRGIYRHGIDYEITNHSSNQQVDCQWLIVRELDQSNSFSIEKDWISQATMKWRPLSSKDLLSTPTKIRSNNGTVSSLSPSTKRSKPFAENDGGTVESVQESSISAPCGPHSEHLEAGSSLILQVESKGIRQGLLVSTQSTVDDIMKSLGYTGEHGFVFSDERWNGTSYNPLFWVADLDHDLSYRIITRASLDDSRRRTSATLSR